MKSYPSLPIWKSGLLASEPDIDQENKSIVRVDEITISSMSGSPVYLTGSPVYLMGNSFTDKHVNQMMFVGSITYFMGVFSHGFGIVYGALWKGIYLKLIFDKLP